MPEREFEALFRQLAEQGFTMMDGQLPADLIDDLYKEGLQAWQSGAFDEARVGPAQQLRRVPAIRGDSIHWIDAGRGMAAQKRFLEWSEDLRQALNEYFYLGLQRSEFHYARYGSGQGYARHMDQHRGQPHRRITLILYLTPDRQPGDGGELCLYHPEAPEREWQRIAPERGRLVLFRSELLPHAVLPAHRPRWSLTGWFRNDQLLSRCLPNQASARFQPSFAASSR